VDKLDKHLLLPPQETVETATKMSMYGWMMGSICTVAIEASIGANPKPKPYTKNPKTLAPNSKA
jgi:hypothetical protein